MMRMIFLSAPRRSASLSSVTPASMETSTASEDATASVSPAKTPLTACGFTPRKTNRLFARMFSAVSGRQSSRAAVLAVCSGVEQVTATRAPPTCLTAATASAPPILPAPIKPAS